MTARSAADVPTDDNGEGSSNTLYYVLGGVAAAIAALFGITKRNAAKPV